MSENFDAKILKKIISWLCGDDNGISSKTIVSAIIQTKSEYVDVPHDPSDFGRCYRLLIEIPELREHLHLVSKKYPKWKGIIENWDRLSNIYFRDFKSNQSNELYRLLQGFRAENKNIETKIYKLNETIPGEDKIQTINLNHLIMKQVQDFFQENSCSNSVKKSPDIILFVKASSLVEQEGKTCIKYPKTITLTEANRKQVKYSVLGCFGPTEIKLNNGSIVQCNGTFDISYQSQVRKVAVTKARAT